MKPVVRKAIEVELMVTAAELERTAKRLKSLLSLLRDKGVVLKTHPNREVGR